MKERTLGELALMACNELPEQWELVVSLENGCGTVSLYDPLGERCVDANSFDGDLETQIIQAIGYAKAHQDEFSVL